MQAFYSIHIASISKTQAFHSTFGGWIMKVTRIPADEQFRLIMEYRASGLTDHKWCLQNDIKPGTFYNWVRRLRQKGCTEIPNALNGHSLHRQEIVKIKFPTPSTNGTMISSVQDEINQPVQNGVMELSISVAVLQIPNGTDPVLLRQTLHPEQKDSGPDCFRSKKQDNLFPIGDRYIR